jgi:hypothetical protein
MVKTANKTKATKVSPAGCLAKLTNAQQLADSRELVKLFKDVTGKSAKMWGPSIVGFDSYHYVYESGREGDAPLIGFAPRKSELVLYLAPYPDDQGLKKKLGKHKAGAGCLYIRKLDDIDRKVLRQLAVESIRALRERYPSRPRQ